MPSPLGDVSCIPSILPFSVSDTLRKRAEELCKASLAASTLATYRSGEVAWRDYCKAYGIQERILAATDWDILGFVAHLSLPKPRHELGLAHGTIKSYLSAVRSAYVRRGLPNPMPSDWPLLELVLRGVKKLGPKPKVNPKMPVTVARLQLLKESGLIDLNTHHGRLLWAIFTLGVLGLFRLGELLSEEKELVHTTETIALEESKSVAVLLKASKTDPFRHGVTVRIFATQEKVCAVEALSLLMGARSQELADAPVFAKSDGKPITKKEFIKEMNSLFARLDKQHGLSQNARKFSGHSLRKGGATSLALRGVPDHVIQVFGRWRSWAYKLYLEYSAEFLRDQLRVMTKLTAAQVQADIGTKAGVSPACATCWDGEDVD